ncbi:glutamine synthetase family protein [Celerinatantimonas sp. YJH-8]|uniref:glutamine synthetase family protein n=1 Tax=Celerinatantimonas sp. YJH-8 TaxID=3228714 RepID=UPI0038BFE668
MDTQSQIRTNTSLSSLKRTVQQFLAQHPDLQSIDLMLHDLSGTPRGKRLDISQLLKVAEEGVCLPASIFALDICGETVEETGLGFEQGDGDRICQLLPHSLSLIPWQEPGCAQGLMTMVERDGQTPFFADPRQVLSQLLQRQADLGIQWCVALELEFYLTDRESDENGLPQPPIAPQSQQRMSQTQVYSLDDLDDYKAFLDDVIAACQIQQVPAENMVAEYAPGQFEVNLHHQTDVLLACDQALLLKRIIKSVARQHGFGATFMAKPYSDYAGNGCHVHISALDAEGQNLFASEPLLLKQAIAGLLAHLPDTMAILAPNANSYRRFQPDMFVPMKPCWGWDNRTVAVRIPAGSEENTRIEHRVAGADANPYLLCAALLASIESGIRQDLMPPDPVSGNAAELPGELLPNTWSQALQLFSESELLSQALGKDFCQVYAATKLAEMQRFDAQVSPLEYQWYQQLV